MYHIGIWDGWDAFASFEVTLGKGWGEERQRRHDPEAVDAAAMFGDSGMAKEIQR